MTELAPTIQVAREVKINLPLQAAYMLDALEAELDAYAQLDDDGCYGYFPGFAADTHLSESVRFSRLVPAITVDELTLGFNFLRYSLGPQPALHGLHLDTDAATAVTGPDMPQQQDREVWRLFLNMDRQRTRNVHIAPNILMEDIQCVYVDGYLAVVSGVEEHDIETVSLPARVGFQVSGLLFCANRVPHMGSDGEDGHFAAGYGVELTA